MKRTWEGGEVESAASPRVSRVVGSETVGQLARDWVRYRSAHIRHLRSVRPRRGHRLRSHPPSGDSDRLRVVRRLLDAVSPGHRTGSELRRVAGPGGPRVAEGATTGSPSPAKRRPHSASRARVGGAWYREVNGYRPTSPRGLTGRMSSTPPASDTH